MKSREEHIEFYRNDDGSEILRVTIKHVDPSAATIAILGAIDKLPAARKPRSDKGKTREAEIT